MMIIIIIMAIMIIMMIIVTMVINIIIIPSRNYVQDIALVGIFFNSYFMNGNPGVLSLDTPGDISQNSGRAPVERASSRKLKMKPLC